MSKVDWRAFGQKYISRKFLLALFGLLAVVLEERLHFNLGTEQQAMVAAIILGYLGVEGVADARRV